MIHPETSIQYIDIKTGEPKYKSINDLYQEYAHKAITSDNGSREISDISFENENILITDLFGWTKLISLTRIKYLDSIPTWRKISSYDKHVIVSDDELIPFYDINDTIIGFHGEVKYKYDLKSINEIDLHEYIRNKGIIDEFGNRKEFSIPDAEFINDLDIRYGYEIITKSEFVNANKFHLWAGIKHNDKIIDTTKPVFYK